MMATESYMFTTKEYALLVDKKAKVTDKVFNIVIPRIMPNIPLGASPKTESKQIKVEMVNSDFKYDSSITLANSIEAKSATYFRTQLLGDVTKMEAVKEAETEDSLLVPLIHDKPVPGASIDPTTHDVKHKHVISKPFKIDQMLYIDFDKDEINNGAKMLVEFIGGDINEVYVTYIPDILPKS